VGRSICGWRRFQATNTRQTFGDYFPSAVRAFTWGRKWDWSSRGLGKRSNCVVASEMSLLRQVKQSCWNLRFPPILESGHYQFLVDLASERVKWFSDMGSEPFIFEIRIEESKSHRGHDSQWYWRNAILSRTKR
jgi:hypothetical protein